MISNLKTGTRLCDLSDLRLGVASRKIASVCARRKTVLFALLFLVSQVILLIENHAKHKGEDSGYLTKSINHADNIFTG